MGHRAFERRGLGLPTDLPKLLRDRLERVITELADTEQPGLRDAWRYLHRSGHLDRGGLTPMGARTVLLSGPDLPLWLLAVEMERATTEWDAEFLSVWVAEQQLAGRSWSWAGPDGPVPGSEAVQWREGAMGLLVRWPGEDSYGEHAELTAIGVRLLTTLLADGSDSLRPLVRALRADDRDGALRPSDPASSAADAVHRHSRLIAHELGNTLGPVRMGLDRLWAFLDGHPDRVEIEPLRRRIDAGVERALAFIDRSRQIADLDPSTRRPFRVSMALRDAAAAVDVGAVDVGAGGAAAELELAEGDVVEGHRERLVVVLVNLLRNAHQIGATRVTATVRATGLTVEVSVEDNGPGVPEALRARVFDNGIYLRPDGSGHGLAMVRHIVEREMRGAVLVDRSEALGGARFVLRLPAAETLGFRSSARTRSKPGACAPACVSLTGRALWRGPGTLR